MRATLALLVLAACSGSTSPPDARPPDGHAAPGDGPGATDAHPVDGARTDGTAADGPAAIDAPGAADAAPIDAPPAPDLGLADFAACIGASGGSYGTVCQLGPPFQGVSCCGPT